MVYTGKKDSPNSIKRGTAKVVIMQDEKLLSQLIRLILPELKFNKLQVQAREIKWRDRTYRIVDVDGMICQIERM